MPASIFGSLNGSPRITLSSAYVAENSATDTVVGTASVVFGTAAGAITLVSQSNANWFKVVSGVVKVATSSPNYETNAAPTVTLTDGVLTNTIAISVTNVFEAASLSALSGTFSLAEDAAANAVAGAISGKTSGSTLSLVDDAGGRVAISGTNIVRGATALDYETATSHSFTIRETLADSANSPRDSVLSLSVTNVTVTLGTVALSSLSWTTAASTSGTITGKTSGSTLSLSGSLPAGLAIDLNALTWTWTHTAGSVSTGSFTIVETHPEATTKNHTQSWSITNSLGNVLLLVGHGDSRLGTVRAVTPPTFNTHSKQVVSSGAVAKGYTTLTTPGITDVTTPYENAVNNQGDTFISPLHFAVEYILANSDYVDVIVVSSGMNGANVAGASHSLGALPDSVTVATQSRAEAAYTLMQTAYAGYTIDRALLTVDCTNDMAAGVASSTVKTSKAAQLASLHTFSGFSAAPIVVVGICPESLTGYGSDAPFVNRAQEIAAIGETNGFYNKVPAGRCSSGLHEGDGMGTPRDGMLAAGQDWGRTLLVALGKASPYTPTITITDNVAVTEGASTGISTSCDQPIYFTVDSGSTSLVTLSSDLASLTQSVTPTGGAWPAYDAGTPANNTRAYTLNYRTGDGVTGSITRHVVINEAAAGIAYVDSASAQYHFAGDGCTTSAINTSSADFLMVSVVFYGGGTPTVSDSKGNTWTALTQYDEPSLNPSIRNFYCIPGSNKGSGHTFSLSGATVYGGIAVTAWSGVHQTSPIDTQTGQYTDAAPNGGGSGTSGSVTPAQNGTLLLAHYGGVATATPSFNTSPSFTVAQALPLWGGGSYGLAVGYNIQTTAASINSGWAWATAAGSGDHAMSLTAIKPA